MVRRFILARQLCAFVAVLSAGLSCSSSDESPTSTDVGADAEIGDDGSEDTKLGAGLCYRTPGDCPSDLPCNSADPYGVCLGCHSDSSCPPPSRCSADLAG